MGDQPLSMFVLKHRHPSPFPCLHVWSRISKTSLLSRQLNGTRPMDKSGNNAGNSIQSVPLLFSRRGSLNINLIAVPCLERPRKKNNDNKPRLEETEFSIERERRMHAGTSVSIRFANRENIERPWREYFIRRGEEKKYPMEIWNIFFPKIELIDDEIEREIDRGIYICIRAHT